jgi:hypothetical protein
VGRHESGSGRESGGSRTGTGWLSRAVRMLTAGVAVFRRYPGLSAMPVLSLLAAALIAVGAVAASSFLFGVRWRSPGTASFTVLLVAGAVVLTVIAFGSAALSRMIEEISRGVVPNSHEAIEHVLKHRTALLRWLLAEALPGIFAVLGTAEVLSGRTHLSTTLWLIPSSLLSSTSFADKRYLMPPVILAEGLRYKQARERVTALARSSFHSRSGRGATGLAVLGCLLFAPVAAVVLWLHVKPSLMVVGCVVAWAIVAGVVLSALQAVYGVALYRFAADGVTIVPFGGEDLQAVFERGS